MRIRMEAARFIAAGLLALSLRSPTDSAEPNNSFLTATVLAPGTLTIADELDLLSGGDGAPDTFLGFFADDTFAVLLEEDDDSSPLGDGLADALFGVTVNSDGSIPLAVTGFGDNFVGNHLEAGDYELFVDVFDSGSSTIDSFSVQSTLAPGVVDQFLFVDPMWIGGTFDVMIDNTLSVAPPDALDFWVFTGLMPGTPINAEMINGDFDMILAHFAPNGTLLATNDDGGVGQLSKLRVTVPATGELVLAVTAWDDFGVTGDHVLSGSYELSLTEIPVYSADFNVDDQVDGDDLTDPGTGWESRFGNDLDGSHFLDWQRQFGSGVPALATTPSVPEPSAWVLFMLGLLAMQVSHSANQGLKQ